MSIVEGGPARLLLVLVLLNITEAVRSLRCFCNVSLSFIIEDEEANPFSWLEEGSCVGNSCAYNMVIGQWDVVFSIK